MKRKLLIIGIIFTALLAGYISLFLIDTSNQNIRYGMSFDPDYARYITKDAGKAYMTALNVWKFKLIRLPIHWDATEKQPGKYDFSDMDWYVNRAKDAGAKVVLSIGQKTPRWPECHIPTWTKQLDEAEYAAALKKYLQAVVEHYRGNEALEMWQVENEPFLQFGICPKITTGDLHSEIALVKNFDPHHPTLVGDSGELSSWLVTGTAGDYFGTTVYRLVYNKFVGFFSYDFIPAAFYRFKLWAVGREASKAFVLELQAEPWLTDKLFKDSTLDEQYQSMNLSRLQSNISYAQQIGLGRVYLWGAEWWYWLLEHDIHDIPDYVKTLPK